ENADDRPDDVKRPLWQHMTSRRRLRVVFPGRKCSVRTQMLSSRGLILQRPFLIDELDVNSRNSVDPRALRPNRRMCRNPVLVARQANEPSWRELQCRKQRSTLAADVLSHGLFTLSYLTITVHQFEPH